MRVGARDGTLEAQERQPGGSPSRYGRYSSARSSQPLAQTSSKFGEGKQVSGRGGRKEVRYAVDRVEVPPAGRPRRRRRPTPNSEMTPSMSTISSGSSGLCRCQALLETPRGSGNVPDVGGWLKREDL